MLQAQDGLSQLHHLSYHRTMPLYLPRAVFNHPNTVHVHTEAELRAAVDLRDYRRFPSDNIAIVVVECSIELSSPLEPLVPVRLHGALPNAECELRVRGAVGVLVVCGHAEVTNLTVRQYNVAMDEFMCGLQADSGSSLVVRGCRVSASGSAVRALGHSRVVLEDNWLQGITSACFDHEDGIIVCRQNQLM
eukprot:m.63083 g.63083  ORF g.63083 m.63083 type:complete len:191 (-) comp13952_c0_seq1:696-1268(-)